MFEKLVYPVSHKGCQSNVCIVAYFWFRWFFRIYSRFFLALMLTYKVDINTFKISTLYNIYYYTLDLEEPPFYCWTPLLLALQPISLVEPLQLSVWRSTPLSLWLLQVIVCSSGFRSIDSSVVALAFLSGFSSKVSCIDICIWLIILGIHCYKDCNIMRYDDLKVLFLLLS